MYDNKDTKVADNKIADNRVLDENETINYKKRINEIDDRIDEEKSKMKNLDEMEELFVSLSKNITKCVDLLNKSIKGNNIANRLNSIEENNKINFTKSIGNLEIEREEIKNRLVSLNNEKDDFQKLMREQNIKEEVKEKESFEHKEQKEEDKEEDNKEGE